MFEEKLTAEIIRAAIEVHRLVGPGLLESAYADCLCHELALRGLKLERQVEISLMYKELEVKGGYRADVIVEGSASVPSVCLRVLRGQSPSRRGSTPKRSYLTLSLAARSAFSSASPPVKPTIFWRWMNSVGRPSAPAAR